MHAAFQDEISQLMFPAVLSPESHAILAARDLKALRDDKQVHYLKVTDLANGEIIAAARWLIIDPPRSREDWEKETREREMPKEGNIELKRAFLAILTEQRIKWMTGKPVMCQYPLSSPGRTSPIFDRDVKLTV